MQALPSQHAEKALRPGAALIATDHTWSPAKLHKHYLFNSFFEIKDAAKIAMMPDKIGP